ncbi:hypothetical protein NJB1907f44_04840 [Mycobacterium marinum]|nr:hypothetical protein NJB1907E90_18430 [Mycobacterium marinum]GJO31391.1 hypothetical protein NJB1907E19_03410 [Mycobacterium marinum]GJO36753.1 hypothetical protein NJB1728e24_11140 [Mycobacterium marinum]GJO43448.1 hypothetical protein NJB1907f3_06250 [Mycobacterium marinum]GJO60802.1 hypothetical protein NJB1728f10_21770 [Mycobacterium marinum]
MGWGQSNSWQVMAGKAGLGNVESSTWLAIAAWAALAVVAVALIVMYRQIQRNQQLTSEQARPYVSMLMEPHITDWHVIELVVRNFGRTAAYNVQFSFPRPPTVAEYENASDGYADVVELQLPRELPTLATGQEWRMVWDSALDRAEIGQGVESRFEGTVTYYDRPDQPRGWRFWHRPRRQLQTQVVLDWEALPPVQRIELMTTHDLAKREKQKLELLRSVLTYFHYFPLREQGDAPRRLPQRDRADQSRRGGNPGPVAHPAGRPAHRRQPALGRCRKRAGQTPQPTGLTVHNIRSRGTPPW